MEFVNPTTGEITYVITQDPQPAALTPAEDTTDNG